MRVTSDDTARMGLASAQPIAVLRAATEQAAALLAEIQLRTRKPHACSVCKLITREDEA